MINSSQLRNSAIWEQRDEELFIDHLGYWKLRQSDRPPTARQRIKLLEGYLQGLALRYRWGQLNPFALEARAKAEITRLQALDPDFSEAGKVAGYE